MIRRAAAQPRASGGGRGRGIARRLARGGGDDSFFLVVLDLPPRLARIGLGDGERAFFARRVGGGGLRRALVAADDAGARRRRGRDDDRLQRPHRIDFGRIRSRREREVGADFDMVGVVDLIPNREVFVIEAVAKADFLQSFALPHLMRFGALDRGLGELGLAAAPDFGDRRRD